MVSEAEVELGLYQITYQNFADIYEVLEVSNYT